MVVASLSNITATGGHLVKFNLPMALKLITFSWKWLQRFGNAISHKTEKSFITQSKIIYFDKKSY